MTILIRDDFWVAMLGKRIQITDTSLPFARVIMTSAASRFPTPSGNTDIRRLRFRVVDMYGDSRFGALR